MELINYYTTISCESTKRTTDPILSSTESLNAATCPGIFTIYL